MTPSLSIRIGLLLALVGYACPASAHRLDEYLQATRLAIEPDRVLLEIDLTAGTSIASRIVDLIDVDRDGRISDAEQDAYSRAVLNSLALSIDGRAAPVTLTARAFPTPDAMAAGIGTIRMRASVPASGGAGRHRLAYRNTHQPEMSVYLVNALVPSDPRVQIGPPHRDAAQHELVLDFNVAGNTAWLRAGWLGAAVLLLGTLGLRLRRRLRRDKSIRRRRPVPAVACLLLVGAVSLCALPACARSRPTIAASGPLDTRFTLAPGETTAINGLPLWVRFDRVVEDSRCPADVACIQAGDGVIGITVIEQDRPARSYQLHTGSPAARSAVHGDITIVLEELTPTPVSSRATPSRAYRATLRASK